LKNHIDVFTNNRNNFYTNKWIILAGKEISLDNIEHGLLRHSKWKLGGGYIGKFITSKWEKKFRMKILDNRIHFALNCGAESCPPVLFYTADNINVELNIATNNFVNSSEVKYD